MMSSLFLLLIIGIAVAVGCYVGQKHIFDLGKNPQAHSKDYFIGLNYLLNEQPDKAVDVFTKLLHIDSDTVETHLALGSLFRRRGEIGRAIKIHQNLIARPQLPKQYRLAALIALGKDYLQAGLIDRAERLFLEITSLGDEPLISLQYLLSIYQQQKNWEAAIKVGCQLKVLSDEPLGMAISHFYCEQALLHLTRHEFDSAIKALKLALKQDEKCVRANLMLGKIYQDLAQYSQAIKTLQNILLQDKNFFSEGLTILHAVHENLSQKIQNYPWEEWINFLEKTFFLEKNIIITLYITEYYRKKNNPNDTQKALDYLTHYLQRFPSLRGLAYFVNFKLESHRDNQDFKILNEMFKNILKNFSPYICSQCGFNTKQLIWLCPGCKEWGEIKPVND